MQLRRQLRSDGGAEPGSVGGAYLYADPTEEVSALQRRREAAREAGARAEEERQRERAASTMRNDIVLR